MAGAERRQVEPLSASVSSRVLPAEPSTRRRYRLIAIISLGMAITASPYALAVLAVDGLGPTFWSFLVGIPLLLLNLPLGRNRVDLAGVLLPLEIVTFTALMAYFSGGFDSASLIRMIPAPLIATFCVGSRFGLGIAGLTAAGIAAFHHFERVGFPFPDPLLPDQVRWFHLAAYVGVLFSLVLLVWLYEQETEKAARARATLRSSRSASAIATRRPSSVRR